MDQTVAGCMEPGRRDARCRCNARVAPLSLQVCHVLKLEPLALPFFCAIGGACIMLQTHSATSTTAWSGHLLSLSKKTRTPPATVHMLCVRSIHWQGECNAHKQPHHQLHFHSHVALVLLILNVIGSGVISALYHKHHSPCSCEESTSWSAFQSHSRAV